MNGFKNRIKKILTFWNDYDGFSAKDFLMVIFVAMYVIEQAVVFVLSLRHALPPDTLEVVKSLNGVIMTIVGGTFGVQTVREFRQPNNYYPYNSMYEQNESYHYSQPIDYTNDIPPGYPEDNQQGTI